RHCGLRVDPDWIVIRPVLDHRTLKLTQPRAHRQVQFSEPVLPDIDVNGLLNRKTEAWRVVLKRCGPYPECPLATDDPVDDSANVERFPCKGIPQTELRGPDFQRRIDLSHLEDKVALIAIDKIPTISLKLMMNVVDDSAWAIEFDRLLPPNQYPQEVVES